MKNLNFLKGKRIFVSLLTIFILGTGVTFSQLVSSPFGWCTVGGSTTGGGSASPVTVNSNSAFRSAVSGNSAKVIYVSGTIDLGIANYCYVGSNTTIIGQGTNARIVHGGLQLNGVSNIIIRNISFEDARDPNWTCETPTEGGQPSNCTSSNSAYDLIRIVGGSNHIWIDHCSFTNGQTTYLAYDGAVDITNGSDYITISYSIFRNNNKGMSLIGGSDSDNGNYRITYAYNWIDDNNSRNPMVRFGRLHMLNNYYSDVSGYCIGLRINCRVYAERNYFYNCSDPATLGTSSGQIQNVGNVFSNSSPNGFEGQVSSVGWSPSSYYSYTSINGSEVPSHVQANAGHGKNLGGGGSSSSSSSSSGGTYYQLRNRGTNMYLDGMGRTSNGSDVGQWANTNHVNAQWTMESAGSYYKLKNRATGLYLDGMGRTSNGSAVGVWSNGSSYNQQWERISTSGYYQFKNRATGLFLDGMGRTGNGDACGQWANTTHVNSQWSLISISSAAENSVLSTTNIDLNIYPNPSLNGKFTVDISNIENVDKVNVDVYSYDGKKIFTREYIEKTKIDMDLPLDKGLYLVVVKYGNQMASGKLTVQ